MDNTQNLSRSELFVFIITDFLDKVKKNLPKKYSRLRELANTHTDLIAMDSTTNANKYFIIIKLCVETKQIKLLDLSLNCLTKLLQNDFLFML